MAAKAINPNSTIATSTTTSVPTSSITTIDILALELSIVLDNHGIQSIVKSDTMIDYNSDYFEELTIAGKVILTLRKDTWLYFDYLVELEVKNPVKVTNSPISKEVVMMGQLLINHGYLGIDSHYNEDGVVELIYNAEFFHVDQKIASNQPIIVRFGTELYYTMVISKEYRIEFSD